MQIIVYSFVASCKLLEFFHFLYDNIGLKVVFYFVFLQLWGSQNRIYMRKTQ